MKSLQSIELFSGAGGLALGLHAAGFRHQALYEWNKPAIETLQFNQARQNKALKDYFADYFARQTVIDLP